MVLSLFVFVLFSFFPTKRVYKGLKAKIEKIEIVLCSDSIEGWFKLFLLLGSPLWVGLGKVLQVTT